MKVSYVHTLWIFRNFCTTDFEQKFWKIKIYNKLACKGSLRPLTFLVTSKIESSQMCLSKVSLKLAEDTNPVQFLDTNYFIFPHDTTLRGSVVQCCGNCMILPSSQLFDRNFVKSILFNQQILHCKLMSRNIF